MAKIEQRMRALNILSTTPPRTKTGFLPDSEKAVAKFGRGHIEDDHIPFMQRGVPILHLIPSPFPEQWHDARGVPDDGAHLDVGAVDDWARIVTAFTAEWMELGEFLPRKTVEKRDGTTSKTEL
ncbi:M28 family peptidase [Candidatus Bathyarchaeota archaeon]|nr:M28 family peptidase [Candidatus Bathyarchaeota archaeon]